YCCYGHGCWDSSLLWPQLSQTAPLPGIHTAPRRVSPAIPPSLHLETSIGSHPVAAPAGHIAPALFRPHSCLPHAIPGRTSLQSFCLLHRVCVCVFRIPVQRVGRRQGRLLPRRCSGSLAASCSTTSAGHHAALNEAER